jgi:hypothetical protein
MAGCGLLSGLAVVALPGVDGDREVLLGMTGPLVSAIATWILVDRTYRSSPARLTSLMVAGFAAKAIFFGAYVTAMLTALALRPVPFVISFTVYFIALYAVEAIAMQRLFASNSDVESGFPPPPKASARLAGARPAREGGSPTV